MASGLGPTRQSFLQQHYHNQRLAAERDPSSPIYQSLVRKGIEPSIPHNPLGEPNAYQNDPAYQRVLHSLVADFPHNPALQARLRQRWDAMYRRIHGLPDTSTPVGTSYQGALASAPAPGPAATPSPAPMAPRATPPPHPALPHPALAGPMGAERAAEAAAIERNTPGGPSADEVHQQRSQSFVHDALADYKRGAITRLQLIDALQAEGNYDYPSWKQENIVHPRHGPAHNVAPEPPPPPTPVPMAGAAPPQVHGGF